MKTINKILGRLGFGNRKREDYSQRRFILDALPKDSVGAEIGVHEGEFSMLLLKRVHPLRLHLIDPWEYRTEAAYSESFYGGILGVDQHAMDLRYSTVLKRLSGYIRDKHVIVHRQRSSVIQETFPQGYFDWIYVDGDHLYDQVRQDLAGYGNRVKPLGWIAGGGFRSDAWGGNGVVRAVEEFLETTPHSEFIAKGDQYLIRVDQG